MGRKKPGCVEERSPFQPHLFLFYLVWGLSREKKLLYFTSISFPFWSAAMSSPEFTEGEGCAQAGPEGILALRCGWSHCWWGHWTADKAENALSEGSLAQTPLSSQWQTSWMSPLTGKESKSNAWMAKILVFIEWALNLQFSPQCQELYSNVNSGPASDFMDLIVASLLSSNRLSSTL